MIPVQITIRDIPASERLESIIREKAEKLNKFNPHIQSCKVVLDVPQKHKQQGKLYRLHIDLTIPHKAFFVNHQFDEDAYVAVRDAFLAMTRQLEEHTRKERERFRGTNRTNGLTD